MLGLASLTGTQSSPVTAEYHRVARLRRIRLVMSLAIRTDGSYTREQSPRTH